MNNLKCIVKENREVGTQQREQCTKLHICMFGMYVLMYVCIFMSVYFVILFNGILNFWAKWLGVLNYY